MSATSVPHRKAKVISECQNLEFRQHTNKKTFFLPSDVPNQYIWTLTKTTKLNKLFILVSTIMIHQSPPSSTTSKLLSNAMGSMSLTMRRIVSSSKLGFL
ncbi:hypothetical protein EUTSA_v10001086mg [Eutrema salsugineum]|uniref:Uncharacterized protein n=1 Tax=Eutrema salsugineum TaxID=72664 RepID=V4LIM8_EUTSA|nr:hypothetical protein EUTSA_v10001086mg [Eutrema salsugineum]